MRNKLDVKKRVKNFDEIVIPFTREQAVAEARRCLRCPNPPCEIACPIKTELRDAFAVLADLGDNACDKAWQKAIVEAYDILKTNNCLPSVTARVCPHSKFCEGACTRAKKERAVDIARLKAYICDTYYKLQAEKMQGQIDKLKAQVKGQEKLQGGAEKDNRAKKQNCVAIIGYGPSAIACAEYLANSGVGVSVYAKYLGGLLNTGIPAFRLPHAVWGNELSFVGASVDLKLEQVSNFNDIKAFTQKLLAKYKAVFVAVGLQKSTSLGIDGEALGNIFYFDSFLKNAKLGIDLGVSIQPKNIAVIGGGNAALDSARVARRIFPSADVQIYYRRSKDEMPALECEVSDTIAEGVQINFLTGIKGFVGGFVGGSSGGVGEKSASKSPQVVTNARFVKMELGKPDDSGRRSVSEILDSEFEVAADMVIIAAGSKLDFDIDGLDKKWGLIEVDNNYKTNIKGLYAGGDCTARGEGYVVTAMRDGIEAAKAILGEV